MSKRVLIVTHRADLHADIVEEKLEARGAAPFRIDLDEFPRDFALEMQLVPQRWAGSLTRISSNDVLRLADVGAVWVRKAADFGFASEDLSPQEQAYAAQEVEHVLSSLLYSLDCYWMSHPLAIRSALWKGEQLVRAARMGFHVPASLIANRGARVKEFSAAVGGDIVFKTLSSPQLAADKVSVEDRIATGLATTRIGPEHADALDAVEELPCFFQEYVAKAYELRVTVIGERLFAAKIHSQDDERTRTDYRDYSAEIRYEATQLPPQIAAQCLEFVHSYRLAFGALDLIVTPQDRYVFLENNPGGQFYFVEQLAPELRMSDAVADRLVEGAVSGR